MDASFHAYQKDVEDWHWWYRVRRDILDQQLTRLSLDPARARILDLGCGTGGAALAIARHGRGFAVDREPGSFALSMDRPYTDRVVASASAPLPFADGTFDVVCALDILEHLDDDAAAARELYRVCKPGGTVIVFVPAFPILWGYNDDYSHHKRRYIKRELSALLTGAGFALDEVGYFNAVLFAPTLAARLLQRVAPKATAQMEHSTKPAPWNDLLTHIFRLELPLLRRAPLPFGTSAFFVGHRA
ncbi:MAG TPA: methyltransferase domain-containing protein [Polyangia bacterium]|jgi:SAM-dependent methyltransferase|nr:methyltransferase domain-containing protein [Polyangia bacterium]